MDTPMDDHVSQTCPQCGGRGRIPRPGRTEEELAAETGAVFERSAARLGAINARRERETAPAAAP